MAVRMQVVQTQGNGIKIEFVKELVPNRKLIEQYWMESKYRSYPQIEVLDRAGGLSCERSRRFVASEFYLGFGLGGFWTPVVSYAPRPMLKVCVSKVII